MNNTDRLADQFSNMAVMISFREIDRELLAAFDRDDHDVVARCGEMYAMLIADVESFIVPARA